MCGGGYKGPSSAELQAQEKAAQQRAQSEADRIKAQRELEKQKENAMILADQVNAADADAARRAKNRTLLAGIAQEEGTGLEDPNAPSQKKAKRATLLGAI
jgi:hypothetical protein